MRALAFLFTLEGRVTRRAYALTGFGLMSLKYALEALVIGYVTGEVWTPLDYLSPFYSVKVSKLQHAPEWFLLVLGVWTLPFVWIGASMTLRRARDAGLGAAPVMAFFLPVLNYAVMIFLALRGSHPLPPERAAPDDEPSPSRLLEPALVAVAVTSLGGLGLMLLCTLAVRSYGTVLFVGVPFAMGFEAAYLLNRMGDRGGVATFSVVTLALLLMACLLLLVMAEGFLCIALTIPVAWPLALFGGLFGRVLARSKLARRPALAPALLLVPLAGLEARLAPAGEFEVVSLLEIDAPRERVWSHVIGFGALSEPEHWIFATGIAYPVRAEIEGEGVGAVRRCEFSTGAFVEPITRWEPPARLSFDVASQPLPMREMSLYGRVHPPHLDDSFRALRGEFRLLELPGGRTRLEGSTWYRLEAFPLAYWRFLSDRIVHRIHLRVLEHVRALSKTDASGSRR